MEDYVQRYCAWVRLHAEDARRLEDLLRLASMVAPGLGGGARSLLGEVLYSLTNVLTLTHDTILDGTRAPSADAALRTALSVLASIDIVVEVTAWRLGGRRSRLQAIFLVEVVRAVLKTLVLARGADRFLVRGGQYVVGAAAGTTLAATDPPSEEWWRGSLTGIALPLPPAYAAAAAAAAAKSSRRKGGALAADLWDLLRAAASACTASGSCADDGTPSSFAAAGVAAPPATAEEPGAPCAARARPLRLLGELLYIWRPVLFSALRLALGGRSWLPLLASCAADAASARLTVLACDVASGLPADAFVPRYTLAALRNTGAQLASVISSIAAGGDGRGALDAAGVCSARGEGEDATGLADGAAAFVTPPGGSPEGALLKALGAPRAGLAGVAIRAALWLFSSPPGLSAAEDAELQRRRALWAFYLLRSPLFFAVTKPAADVAVATAAYVPLLGSLAAYGASVLTYVQGHQMYTAASQG